jgi:nucleoside-diphosphate-sugar epimerase
LSLPFPRVAIVGGAGYVGSALVPTLLDRGYEVKVLDLFIFGDQLFKDVPRKSALTCVKVDVRNAEGLRRELSGMDAVIHLACVSNDPSFELDPALGKSINYDAMSGFIEAVRACKIRRLIYASSSSVYGVREEPNVTEESPCTPLTDYSKFKLLCEQLLLSADLGETEFVIVRPATVCGYAPRLRLDLTVNILTIHGLVKKEITVFGGRQLRPNINMKDMIEVYRVLLEAPKGKIHRQVFNAGYSNRSVSEIAELVRRQLGDSSIRLDYQSSNDLRSYHVNSDKLANVLGFRANFSLEDAVQSLVDAYRAGRIPDALTRPAYYNIKVMQSLDLRQPVPDVHPILSSFQPG